MPHNPNPFDFVPFAEKPYLRTFQDFDQIGTVHTKLSGYIELKVKALTPIHVVGALRRGDARSQSSMYRQDDQYIIPAATIRGALRSFVEAVTSGWVSQANEHYPKTRNERHIGFSLFEEFVDSKGHKSPPAIDPDFQPQRRPDGKIDLASYLFGIVTEPAGTSGEAKSLVVKSKVWVEDAVIDPKNIVQDTYWAPDISSASAFMGGASPSASNWWYFKPSEVWRRAVKGNEFAEFVGRKLRGRKFYFHQDPSLCTAYYDPAQAAEWDYGGNGFHKIFLEAMEAQTTSQPFRIYLDKIPVSLVSFLTLVLEPGQHIRHKLGYGKAYGYGSIAFEIQSLQLRPYHPGKLPGKLQRFDELKMHDWKQVDSPDLGLSEFVDKKALQSLARILGWSVSDKLIFTYPPYENPHDRAAGFKSSVRWSEFVKRVRPALSVSPAMTVTPSEARLIAEKLFSVKKPINLEYYQERANGWPTINSRKP
jgi:hypothetical protein